MRKTTFSLLAGALFCLTCAACASSSSSTLSLLTYNIHAAIPMGFNSASYKAGESDLRNLADVIVSSGADIVALQEVHCEFALLEPPQRRFTSALNQPRLLAAFASMHYLFASTLDDLASYPENVSYLEWGRADRWTNNGAPHGEFGNALLSRYGFEQPAENICLPREKEAEERRACLRIKLDERETSGIPIVVYATHLHHDNGASRLMQMQQILQRAGGESSAALTFILGDMNAQESDKADVIGMIRRAGFYDLHDQYARASGQTPQATVPADAPKRRIDYIFCNRPLRVAQARVLESLASDHRPLLVRVELELE